MKRLLALLFCTTFSICAFASCGRSELTEIKVNEVTHSVFYAPLYLAIENDFFKEQGIDIKLTNGGGADKTMAALLSGNCDIAFCGPEASIYVINEGKENPPKVFAQLTKRDGSFLVGRQPDDDFNWKKLENKKIIAGRTGGVPAMTFEYVVNKHGLFNGKNVTLDNNVQFNLMGASFEGGNGDYVTLFEPTASEFQKLGKGYVVASVGAESGEIPYTAFSALSGYIKENRDILIKFLTALQKAEKFVKENSAEECARIISPQFPDTPLEALSAAITSYTKIDAWCTNFAMTADALERLQSVMTAAGELGKKVNLNQLCDNTIAKEVYKKIYG